MRAKKFDSLRLILGDQLDEGHSWFRSPDAGVLYVIAELHQETGYVKHHVQKLCAFFAAMEAFAVKLRSEGHDVLHLTLDETVEFGDLSELIQSLCKRFQASVFEFQSADEYRLQQQLQALDLPAGIYVKESDSEHFLLPREELGEYVTAGRHNRMETFYRKMRKRFDILMEDDKPTGGKWNYDSENRHKLKADDFDRIPAPLCFDNDASGYLRRIEAHRIESFGEPAERLLWPVSRSQSLQLLDYFCRHCLPYFGRFQDAMTCRHEHRWSLYHSRLSFALNTKLLSPREVTDTALERFEASKGVISLAQIEGFIRQILGWREYVRAVYWVNMPQYAKLNQLDAKRDLPAFFWSADTRMNCMRQALGQSLQYAYAHHIQRLMITGNFCLLAGIHPDQVDNWYLGVYVDAIEWVEMPNTRGMSQFADDGIVATKPYSAGANYINKMSDYCGDCHYDYRQRSSDSACPFNSLYWNFMVEHRDRLDRNPRIGMIYRNWDKQPEDNRKALLKRAAWILSNLESL